ncbi:uncharacterized protein LOC118276728 [Spodoptera frugiperda]|uniref:Uncharacterized protein LOC118276728 n=1 Tax=Spodoptera frugiperda TaxID=7108 RepID=A0A9R0F1L8_SPOFR|nr:uncharacterized protein LOC118276728 [Spodoptera frugiperda]
MKVIIAIIFAIGSVSALGSGPYLPSGWRPSGPSFYLPSEVAKSSEGPVKENLLQETEASGSDALREYGPPKEEEIQYSVNQGLPDVATEQTFFVQSLATQELQAGAGESVAVEVNTESAAIVEEVASTAEAVAEKIEQAEVISEVQPTLEAVAEVVEQTEAAQAVEATEAAVADIVEPTAAVEEVIVAEEVVPTVVVEEAVPTAVVEEAVVEKVAQGVNNIAEAIVQVETEANAAEAVESAVEIKQKVSGSLQQAPEGFLEYGPPGFREYGPPKSAAVQAAPENNEVRRRRFSPKFKSHKKH